MSRDASSEMEQFVDLVCTELNKLGINTDPVSGDPVQFEALMEAIETKADEAGLYVSGM